MFGSAQRLLDAMKRETRVRYPGAKPKLLPCCISGDHVLQALNIRSL